VLSSLVMQQLKTNILQLKTSILQLNVPERDLSAMLVEKETQFFNNRKLINVKNTVLRSVFERSLNWFLRCNKIEDIIEFNAGRTIKIKANRIGRIQMI